MAELEDIPPTAYPDGSVIGNFDAGTNPPESPEILHRPHAFALMHGDDGAKVAYGELRWRVDVLKFKFQTSAIAVADHADHAHEHDHTHAVSGTTGSGPTGSGSDTVTTAINDATTGNVNGGSGTVTTSQPDDATTGTDVAAVSGYGSTSSQTTTTSGIQSGSGYGDHTHDIAHGHDVAMSHTHEHDHTHTAGVASHTHEHDHTHTIPAHQHSFADTSDSPNEATTSGVKATDGSTYGSGSLTHTVSGQITYCAQTGQESIGKINQQVPKVDAEDGDSMDATIPNIYHQLSSYGDVYLCWKADLEQGAGSEITHCWVQIGEPANDDIDELTLGNSTTNRRDASGSDGITGANDNGIYSIKLGTVNDGGQITQKVSSDVVWSPTVMDRIGP